jgi:hypothetical protein
LSAEYRPTFHGRTSLLGTAPIRQASDNGDVPDNALPEWPDISAAHRWDAILLGNGLSVNVWEPFGYRSLYETAVAAGVLDEGSIALFEQLDTRNFEQVLSDLGTAINVDGALGNERSDLEILQQGIRGALAEAVRETHVPWQSVPDERLERIRAAIIDYSYAFTTSYDLLIYWAAGQPGNFDGFKDFFWGQRNSFNGSDVGVPDEERCTRLYFLHGALHLVEVDFTETRKRTSTHGRLLDQFGQEVSGVFFSLPLVITEGTSVQKARAIRSNEYLSFCMDSLRGCGRPLVVFGHNLGQQDVHLAHAINEHSERPVAVGIASGTPARMRRERAHYEQVLDSEELLFFDRATHPLGDPDLGVG